MSAKFDLKVVVLLPDAGDSMQGLRGGVHASGGDFIRPELDIAGYCKAARIDPVDLTEASRVKAAEIARTAPPKAWLKLSHVPAT